MKMVACMFALGAVFASPAAAQTGFSRGQWVKMASEVYPGGTVAMDVVFDVPVEARQIGVEVPGYCAPKALASRAQVLVSGPFGDWTRNVPLRYVKQDHVGGYIRAYYVVDVGAHGGTPMVSGLEFSLTQVLPGPPRSCRMDFYALPSPD